MENPFVVTGRIKPAYFCDRREEAARLIRCITSGENVVLMAPRRVGKSKLIDFCMEDPQVKDRYNVIAIDILRTSSIQELTYELGKAVFQQAASRGQRVLKQVVNTLKSINGCFGYDPVSGLPTFSVSLGDIVNPQYTLEEIFSCLEQADRPNIVVIDEFQQICYYPEKNMEAILRSHIQQCGNAHFVFSGSERHLINAMFSEKAHPFYNSADVMNLGLIPADKYAEFVRLQFKSFGRSLDEQAPGYVYQTFKGNTYYNQKVFHEAFNLTPEGGALTLDVVKDIIQTMILDADRKYSEMLSRLTLPQKELLYAIARDGEAERLTSGKFLKRHNLRSASSVQSATKKLVEHHFISRSQNFYYVEDQLMELWLNA